MYALLPKVFEAMQAVHASDRAVQEVFSLEG